MDKLKTVPLSVVEGSNLKLETPLPCPFCAETKIVSIHQERSIVFKCSNCGAQTDDTLCHKTREDALEKWNMRAENY